ncbi:hypothetical protein [Brevibacillus porteri]|uniref:BC1872 family protein n=1 Tax=Brevibacillus porteri TaxID=2126350 RepID=UPI00363D575E
MQAGRELDAKIAELVNGWSSEYTEHLKKNDGWILIPHYSTTWNGMERLLEEVKNNYPLFELVWNTRHEQWMCDFNGKGIGEYETYTHAKTAPLVVCLAYLKVNTRGN